MASFVYMMASRPHGTLYIGVTNNLARRVFEHQTKVLGGFTARYDVARLVWYETYESINEAIAREKDLKRWRRDWKLKLVEDFNPGWSDLYSTLAGF
ncbi:GIY-YIG nuclease family protein [Methylobacterium indicum]|uniref:GIY-YIG nuclease n=1 Tax=Methylobacterium indicum TaxID=1775910 RepID=A0ABR5HGQ3_9HYPH|nr:GIY-YIG nuclease family protein [Methylobacterium indicum]KMO17599.1 GIY-YIG nuclease [Methylobacterium indicum]KMO25810.1 GIY-YIG nuclease [Methylobacterium indicum]